MAAVSSALPHPFLKWVGGKRSLIPQIAPHLPAFKKTTAYFEPFLGGGAMFFHLLHVRAHLWDINGELVNCWKAVRDDVEGLIALLSTYPYDREFYYQIRAEVPPQEQSVARAARLIYLNRSCFNGLYRVNQKGEFNVPFGRYKNPVICDSDNLRRCAAALRGVDIDNHDFEALPDRVKAGDFVYMDPPYVPMSLTSSFTSYIPGGFGASDQERLAGTFRELAGRKVTVILSNSNTDVVRELYAGFRMIEIEARRNVNSRGDRRGPIKELLIIHPSGTRNRRSKPRR